MARRHNFHTTDVELHGDGSMTVHHMHEEGPHKDLKHAVGDIEELHDCFEDHLNPEEMEKKLEAKGVDAEGAEEAIHPGIHEQVAELADKLGK